MGPAVDVFLETVYKILCNVGFLCMSIYEEKIHIILHSQMLCDFQRFTKEAINLETSYCPFLWDTAPSWFVPPHLQFHGFLKAPG